MFQCEWALWLDCHVKLGKKDMSAVWDGYLFIYLSIQVAHFQPDCMTLSLPFFKQRTSCKQCFFWEMWGKLCKSQAVNVCIRAANRHLVSHLYPSRLCNGHVDWLRAVGNAFWEHPSKNIAWSYKVEVCVWCSCWTWANMDYINTRKVVK